MPHLTKKISGALAGFTLVELMIVVVIIAILSLVALPNYKGHLKASRMSEGVTGLGVIRTALGIYSAGHGGEYPTISGADGDELSLIGIAPGSLKGRFFDAGDYEVNSAGNGYTIRVTLREDSNYWCQVDNNGNETRGYE